MSAVTSNTSSLASRQSDIKGYHVGQVWFKVPTSLPPGTSRHQFDRTRGRCSLEVECDMRVEAEIADVEQIVSVDGSSWAVKVYLVGRYLNRVELTGLEPATCWLQTSCSTN